MTDLTTGLNPLLEFASTVAVGLFGLAVTQATQYVRTWLQRQMVNGAASTAAGRVLLMLSQGLVTLTELHSGHAAVAMLADLALDSVPGAAKGLGLTSEVMANKIIGLVGHALSADPTVSTVATASRLPKGFGPAADAPPLDPRVLVPPNPSISPFSLPTLP